MDRAGVPERPGPAETGSGRAPREGAGARSDPAPRAPRRGRGRTSTAGRERRTTIEALLESASEGILMVDADGAIRVANAAVARMFGYEREELIGQSLEMLLPDRVRGEHARHRAGFFAVPRARPMGQGLDLAARRRDGSEFPVEVSLSHIRTATGPRAIAFITDISARKQSEDELRRQREALHQQDKLAGLGALAAGLAHEINNPLGIISSRIELILTEPGGAGLPVEVREDLEVIQRNVRRVGRIAHALLSFARQSPRTREPVDLTRVVRETLLLVERQMTRGGITFTTSLGTDLPPVLGDFGSLQQVVLNLLTNAREAMGGEGAIHIETRLAGEERRIEVLVGDTGPGIPPDVLPRVFDPFFTTKAHGTGLGLSLSYGIVQDHEGTIDVRSEPGQGTVFVIALPAMASPGA